MTNQAKRYLSIGVFSLGMCVGLYGCAILPGSLFTIGANDSLVATPIMVGSFAFFFPTCLLALWKRRQAASILLVMAVLWVLAIFIENHYLVVTRGFPSDSSFDLFKESLLALMPLSLDLFGFFTDRARWPLLLSRRPDAEQ
jgi:hypothetical protein